MSSQILQNVIDRFKNENEFDDSMDIFSIFSLMQIFKKQDIELSDIEDSIIDGGGDGGIDSIIIMIDGKLIRTMEEFDDFKNENNNQVNNNTRLNIYFSQIKKSSSFKELTWEKMLSTFMFAYENSDINYCLNPETEDKINLVKTSIDFVITFSNLISIKINYITKGDTLNISDGVKLKGEQLVSKIKQCTNTQKVELAYYGGNELREIFNTPLETESIIKYEKMLEKSFNTYNDNSFVILVTIGNYYDFITSDENELRETIFEDNIRHFEGNVMVNNAIIKTLKEEPFIEFWALNNGITILADEIIPITNNRLRINNLQIVNGLQTSFCIYNYFKNTPDDLENEKRSILVKIIKVTDETISDRIIKCTNSQTAVRPADLRATDTYQRDIENNFLANGFYYNRRKNYYKNQGKPRAKIYSIANTAQYVEAILFASPSSARNNPTSLLKKDTNYNKIFNKKNDINIYRQCCMIFSNVKKVVKTISRDKDIIREKYNSSVDIFMLHLSYIVTCIITENNVNQEKIQTLVAEDITPDVCNDALQLLITVIDNSPKANVITLSKSSKFDLAIKENLNAI
ncbi:MAG: AIPR family protein [Eubacteriales bacterium]|nr:AIPR family protein [Eubacteriales bacterium]